MNSSLKSTGTLILVVGLPGSGKGTLIEHLRGRFPAIVFPPSWTTRPPRPGERDGEVYHFAAAEEFDRAAREGKFLEWVSIDGGHRYGTLKDAILEPLREGKTVLREVEVEGARRLRTLVQDFRFVTIFVDTESWERSRERMLRRAPMPPEELEARRMRFERERAFRAEADHTVESREGELPRAKEQIEDLVRSITRGD